MEKDKTKHSWWGTIPGILTAVAGVITALSGLIVALGQMGFFEEESRNSSPVQEIKNGEPKVTPTPQSHCKQPTIPALISPGENQVQPNHYYGKGKPLQFKWLSSSCNNGTIKGYRIYVKAVGSSVPATDKFILKTEYTGGTGGTISAHKWTWKVRAIDDLNQSSEWSEERGFLVGEWKQ